MSKKLTHKEFIEKLWLQNKHFSNEEFDITEEYINSTTKINCRCYLGHMWSVRPAHLLHNNCGCPYCCGNAIWKGFNDLWTTRPDIAKLLKNYDDGYKFGQYSNQKTEFVCPRCDCVVVKSIDGVSRQGLSCSLCADGVSYPNKFGRALLRQLPIEDFEYEYSPKWAHPYRYDNYFKYKGKSYILEMDGSFHFEEKTCSKLSLEEVKQIDDIKTKIANDHDIAVIRIDCRISNFDYIKQSILWSKLNQLFDLSLIDWDLCDKTSCNSFVKTACDLYMSGIHSTTMIGRMLCVSSKTIVDYLKRGTRVGWCDYALKDSVQRRVIAIQKLVVVTDLNDNIIYTFDSVKTCINELSRLYNIPMRYDSALRACGKNRPYKGFKFKYINNTQQNDYKE